MAKEIEKKETHETKNIYEKLLLFQGRGITFEKSANNPFFKSKYTPLDDLNVKIKPILTELWLFIYHTVDDCKVTTTIVNCHNTKELLSSIMIIPSWVTDPQKIGSAITYYKRYNTVALLNLDSETDWDGNDTKSTKEPFDKKAQEVFKVALVNWAYALPQTIELLYKDLEKRYILSKENKEELLPLYEVIEETKKETL